MLLHLGTHVRCSDGAFGELDDVVICPRTRFVTHVVVAPRHHHSQARLVPIELVTSDPEAEDELRLRCTREVALELPATQDFAYVRLAEPPPPTGDWDVGIQRVLTLSPGVFGNGLIYAHDDDPHVSVMYDRIPAGEVEVRHQSEVTAADGKWIGYLDSLSVDAHGAITDMTFESGHLWRHHRITVPASAVAEVAMDGLTLALSKPEVDALVPARHAATQNGTFA
jgi:hypothetical protein